VNNGRLLIADFGLSKQLTEITSNSMSDRMGFIEYIDPQCFKEKKYVRRKESDIYSLGVLFWEITSGHPPFFNWGEQSIVALCHHIGSGHRENPIEDTPLEYQQLYQKCWDNNPESRPDIDQVYEVLKSLLNVYGPDNYSSIYQDDLNIRAGQSDLFISESFY
jgi:serine/threonine protein kinase